MQEKLSTSVRQNNSKFHRVQVIMEGNDISISANSKCNNHCYKNNIPKFRLENKMEHGF
jgi:hypothetical protein